MKTAETLNQDPREHEFVQNPYALYNQLHRTGEPVFWKNYGFWCLPSFDDVNSVLRDRQFARVPPPGHEALEMPTHLVDFAASEKYSLLALEPPAHTRLRKLVNRAFLNRQVNLMSSGIRELANRCLDEVQLQGQFDVLKDYAAPIPVTVITRLLGVSEDSGQQLIVWSHAMVQVYTLTQSVAEEHLANQAAAEFQEFLKNCLARKRKEPGDDLLSHLIQQQNDEEPLSDEEIICVAILLLNAGHEATVHQLGNAVLTLLNHYPIERRDQLLSLLADDTSADAIVTECLRFAAPLHLFTRYAQTSIKLNEHVRLEPGDQVGLLLAAANRCPRRFKDPEQFNPKRDDAGHLSLGAGIHFCVGAHLAKLELRIALQVLFSRFPTLRLSGTAVYQNSYHFHGLEKLPVTWEPKPNA
ncbi:MAG: cytochrome P450 [bacterium]|jgi:unspecific monooxygenase